MYACTCTCVRGITARSSTAIARSSRRTPKSSSINAAIITRSESSSSRLEWDTSKKQWIKKQLSSEGGDATLVTTPSSPPRRPNSHAERQAILRQLKEQRMNEVTELDSDVKPVATTTTTAASSSSSESTATTTTASTSAPNDKASDDSASSDPAPRNASTSGRRYMRGQDSSTLKIETAKTLHGVPIPIRPLPPESTDCCMSGCPRCVYDIYTEDLQIHFEAMDKAIKELRKKGVDEKEWPIELKKFADAARSKAKAADGKTAAGAESQSGAGSPAMFSDDDSDGVSAFDIASQVVTDEMKDLDISLRTFLKFERELRQRRKKERALKMALENVSSMSSSQPPTPSVGASA